MRKNHFTLKDGNLIPASEGSFAGLVTMVSEDYGDSFEMTDAKIAREVEGFQEDIQAFAEQIDEDSEDYYENSEEDFERTFLEAFLDYTKRHEDIQGMEYQGEILSVDEIREIVVDIHLQEY